MNEFFEKNQIWKVAIVFIVANILNYVIGLGLKGVFNFSTSVGGELVRGLMFAIIIAWFAFSFARNNVKIGPQLKNLKNDINIKEFSAVIIFNYAVSIAMVMSLLLVITKLLPTDLINAVTEGAVESQEFAGALIGLITASILAPIAEELLFRGVLLTRMKSRMGVVAAIVVSSLLFGMTHLSLAILRSAIFGACMCILYLKTKNIWVPIVLHMVYNFLLTIAGSYQVLFGIQTSAETSLVLNTTTSIIEITVAIVVMIISGIYLSKKFNFFSLKSYKTSK